MKFQLRTVVPGNPKAVFERFDRELLVLLSPPGMKLDLRRFDHPPLVGGRVQIEVKMLGLVKHYWDNAFTEYHVSESECYFVDEGLKMPFPIKYWRHKHLIIQHESGSEIVDDISYKTGFFLSDWLLFPIVWLQFLYRKPIYRKFFKAK